MSYPQTGPLDGARPARAWYWRVGFIAIGALVIAGVVYALAGTLGTTGSRQASGDSDTRTKLVAGMSAVVQTEARAVVQARIRSIAPDLSGLTATVAGLAAGDAGTWSAVLDDGSELPLVASMTDEGAGLVAVSIPQAPAGRTIEAIRLDPDETAGDIYFDVE